MQPDPWHQHEERKKRTENIARMLTLAALLLLLSFYLFTLWK